ncbi:MAG: hypothetical protein IPN76_34925 [Saprospiraceae bacterium]|nr:hypothetical protein [Saprospiraceae bacterium]
MPDVSNIRLNERYDIEALIGSPRTGGRSAEVLTSYSLCWCCWALLIL